MPQKYDHVLVNAAHMLWTAWKNHYAVAHININNLEWAKTALLTAQKHQSPIILGVSMGAAKYMGGYQTVAQMVVGLVKDLKITVPVALHLDHGNFEACKLAIAAGFSSVMFDGSHLSFHDNFEHAQEIISLAKNANVSVEVEVGTIGGEEDGIQASGEIASVDECVKMAQLDISMLAAGIGNVHGIYPENWTGLNFEVLANIANAAQVPLVLHGGSGIPNDQITKAISLGIAKINVNTELQLAFAHAVSEYVKAGHAADFVHKGFDPRKIMKPGMDAMAAVIVEKMQLFGSTNRC